MSVLDQFRDAEQRVVERLKELEPAVTEYRELEQVAQRLGVDLGTQAPGAQPGANETSRTKRAARRSRSVTTSKRSMNGATGGRARRRRPTASPGQRAEQLLALVRERPGITVADAGKELGVDATGLYRVVKRLEERGELRKHGRKLEPAGATQS
jgi:flagellar motor protein MotB